TTTTTTTPGTTTTTTATTSSVPDLTTTTTTGPVPTTGPVATSTTTSTTTTTGEMTTTIGDTETGGETTEGLLPPQGPYQSCSNELDIDCAGGAACVDATSTADVVKGSFCAPPCEGAMNTCPAPPGLDPDVQAYCAFDTNADMKPDICALLCQVANDDCPEGSQCEDIGIPEMMMLKFGICTFP